MRYALISDIHGNIDALNAVLEHTKSKNIDQYIFLGDYYCDFPYPNECVETIRSIKRSIVIGGNKETYLKNFLKKNPNDLTEKQFSAIYWNLSTLTKDNLNYLTSLPETSEITMNGIDFHLTHASSTFFEKINFVEPSCTHYAPSYKKSPFTPAEYNNRLENGIRESLNLSGKRALGNKNIYLFGHLHVQWHCKVDGIYFINPGSAGLPMDMDKRAPYTVLDCSNNNYSVEEYRVSYDFDNTIASLLNSELYNVAPIWSELILQEYSTAIEHVHIFFDHAKKMGIDKFPIPNEKWEHVGETWFQLYPKHKKIEH